MTVLLNARRRGDDINPNLAAFLDYVAGGDVGHGDSAFVGDVDAAVASANADTEFMEGVMQIDEKLWISKQEGFEEGGAEGAADRQRKIAQLAARMAAVYSVKSPFHKKASLICTR